VLVFLNLPIHFIHVLHNTYNGTNMLSASTLTAVYLNACKNKTNNTVFDAIFAVDWKIAFVLEKCISCHDGRMYCFRHLRDSNLTDKSRSAFLFLSLFSPQAVSLIAFACYSPFHYSSYCWNRKEFFSWKYHFSEFTLWICFWMYLMYEYFVFSNISIVI